MKIILKGGPLDGQEMEMPRPLLRVYRLPVPPPRPSLSFMPHSPIDAGVTVAVYEACDADLRYARDLLDLVQPDQIDDLLKKIRHIRYRHLP
jgi:hypothetical protein